MAEKCSETNQFRKMKRAVGYPKTATPITYIDIPTASGGKSHPILDPSDQFSRAVKDTKMFKRKLAGGADEIPIFWNGVKHHPLYLEIAPQINLEKSFPFWIHGDGAPTNKVDGLFTVSFGSMLARGATAKSRFIFTVVRESDITDGTLEVIFDYLAYSLNMLVTGVYPEFQFNGLPHRLAGKNLDLDGWRAAPIFLKGDWEFLANIVHLPRWDNVLNMCTHCKASNDPASGLLWTDGSDWAGWRPTMRDHATFLDDMRAQGRVISGLWKITTLTVHGVCLDVLHALDLGVSSHLCADIFVEIMDTGVWGNNQEKKAEGLEKEMKKFYEHNKHKYKIQGELGYARIRTSNEWPKLKAKGSQIRHICKFALQLATEHHSGTQHDKDRLLVITFLCRYYDIIEADQMFHSDAAKKELRMLGKLFFCTYTKLAAEALEQNRRAWKIPAKMHLFVHLCEDTSSLINARYIWCYSDEDLMKVVKEIAVTTHPNTMCMNVLYKIVVYDFYLD